MEEADAWRVLRGILSALAYIHSQVGGSACRARCADKISNSAYQPVSSQWPAA